MKAATEALRARVAEHLSTAVSDADCVATCTAAALPRDLADVLPGLLSGHAGAAAVREAERLALRPHAHPPHAQPPHAQPHAHAACASRHRMLHTCRTAHRSKIWGSYEPHTVPHTVPHTETVAY